MDFFQSQVRELVQRYRSLPEDFDEKFKSAASLRAKKKASMTPEEQANEVFDAYLGTLGLNEKKWREERRRQAAAAARCDLLLEAVAEAEHMTVSPADLEAMLSEIAQRCGLEVEQVREEADLEPIRRQLLRDKAYRLLLDTAEGQEEQVC